MSIGKYLLTITQDEADKLVQYRKWVRQMRRISAELDELKECASGVGAQKLTGMPGSGNVGDPVGSRAQRRVDLENRFSMICNAICFREPTAKAIVDKLPPKMYSFGVKYYLSGWPLDRVARYLHRDEHMCMRMRNKIEGREKKMEFFSRTP